MRLSRLEEEFLEAVWTALEQDKSRIDDIAQESDEDILPALEKLEEKGYVCRKGEIVVLTPIGEEAARGIVRCHRLGECLVWQGLRTNSQRMEKAACAFEHILLPEIVDSICVLLGHPKFCPHGKPVPPGRCCKEAWASVGQALVSISDLEPGTSATIACLRPDDPAKVQRLLALGLLPGRTVTVQKTEPALLLVVGASQLAIDAEMAAQVFVWTGSGPGRGRRHARRRRQRRWGFLKGKGARSP